MSHDSWNHSGDLACPAPTPSRSWSFAMDAATPIAEPADPDAAPTPADLAFEHIVTTLRARRHAARAGLTRLLHLTTRTEGS